MIYGDSRAQELAAMDLVKVTIVSLPWRKDTITSEYNITGRLLRHQPCCQPSGSLKVAAFSQVKLIY